MKYDPNKHHRRSIRLTGYDYSQPGAYFVTLCVQGRECVLGDVVDGHMMLNNAGQRADQFWPAVADHFADVEIDTWVTMPNHVHAIIVIGRGVVSMPNNEEMGGEKGGETTPQHGGGGRGVVSTPNNEETGGEKGGETPPLHGGGGRGGVSPPTLGQIVAYFKYQTTKSINQMRETPGARFWQRNYWEHVIRDETDLNRIRQYIQTNPLRWVDDQLHPDAPPNKFNRG